MATKSAAIVLGVTGWPNGSLYPEGKLRVKGAVELLNQGKVDLVIFSGGKPRMRLTEAEAMARYARKLGVDPERIITESRSRATHENALFSLEMAHRMGLQNLFVVTSDFHIPRSQLLFEKAERALSERGLNGRMEINFAGVAPHKDSIIRRIVRRREMARFLNQQAYGTSTPRKDAVRRVVKSTARKIPPLLKKLRIR